MVVHLEEEVVGATGDVGRECEMELDRLPASGRQGGGGPVGLYGEVTAFFGYLQSMLSIISVKRVKYSTFCSKISKIRSKS